MKKREFEQRDMSKNYLFLAFLNNQDSNAKINIHHFSIEQSSSSKEVLLERLMEELKFVVMAQPHF